MPPPRVEAQLTFRLPSALARRLDAAAERLGVERSELLRAATAAYLEVADSGRQSPYERAKPVIGSLRSDVPDLGSAHREHLKKKIKKKSRRRER